MRRSTPWRRLSCLRRPAGDGGPEHAECCGKRLRDLLDQGRLPGRDGVFHDAGKRASRGIWYRRDWCFGLCRRTTLPPWLLGLASFLHRCFFLHSQIETRWHSLRRIASRTIGS